MKIGIDFGTTNCTVGLIREDGSRFLTVPPIPSVGAWSNGDVVFGTAAKQRLRDDGERVYPIRDLKLSVGVRDVMIGATRYPAGDFAVKLFRHLFSESGVEASSIDEAVMSTPVKMCKAHRVAMREAAVQSGVRNVRFIYEPTAALIGAGRFRSLGSRDQILVVDWGGGTLDVSVVVKQEEVYRELAVYGEGQKFGGTYIDQKLTESVLRKNRKLGEEIDKITGFDRLKDEVEDLKLELLEDPETESDEEALHVLDWLPDEAAQVRLTAREVNAVMRQVANDAATEILQTLRLKGQRPEDITHVLFAGGVGQNGDVQDQVQARFPNAERIHVALPQTVTGAGCTELTGREFSMQMAQGFGVRQADGSVCVILPQGLPTAQDTHRQSDFVVVDPQSREAILDLGLVRGPAASARSLSAAGDAFVSMAQIYLPTRRLNPTRHEGASLERVKLLVGFDRDLVLDVRAFTTGSKKGVRRDIDGIPMAVRVAK